MKWLFKNQNKVVLSLLHQIFTSLILIVLLSLLMPAYASAVVIDLAEYFFDNDPGEGNGIVIPVIPGGGPDNPMQIDFSVIDTSGLSIGSHYLNIRARCDYCADVNGNWSYANWGPARQYIINITSINSYVAGAEIFVDADPGEGAGTPVAVPVDGNYDERIESVDTALGTATWTTGPHTVYIRARNSNGLWGQAKPLFSDTANNVNVVGDKWVARAEYFLDTDPGEGFAVPLSLYSTGGYGVPARIDLSGISLKNLSIGPHTLNIRAQDSEGVWGPARQISFNVIQSNYSMTGAEFFVDTDTGAGSGDTLTPYDGGWDEGSELVASTFNTGIHGIGTHTLCARGRDYRGWGGNISCTSFEIQDNANKAIVAGFIKENGTGLPLNGVRVYSPEDGAETYSQFDGSYSLIVPEGPRRLQINMGGYQPVEVAITVVAPRFEKLFNLVRLEQPFGQQPNVGVIADPVNTATGNYFFSRTDLKVPASGIPFEFSRYYNAQDLTSGSLGFGWSHNLDVRIYQLNIGNSGNNGEDIVIAKYGDGHTERYQSDGLGGYISQPGIYAQLYLAGGVYELLTKEDIHYLFDLSGRLSSVKDKKGNTLTINRDGAGKITTAIDPAGRTYTFTYNTSGFLSSITDPIGRVIQYSVNDLGNLTTDTDSNGNITNYTYDSHHLLLTVRDPMNNNIVSNIYDAMRRIVSLQKDAYGNTTSFTYDPLSRTTTIDDPMQGKTRHIYDEHLRLIEEVNPLNYSNRYEYDFNNNRIKVWDRKGSLTTYAYDTKGNVLTKADALGNIVDITYDSKSNPLTRTDALGYITVFEYDANGNLIKTTDPAGKFTTITYNTKGLPLTITDANGNTINSTYDVQGNLTGVTDALGNSTVYTNDGAGRRITVTDAIGRTTSYTYDNNDNLLEVSALDIADPLHHVSRYTYDDNNNRLSVTDPKSNTTQYSYDAKDRLVKITDPLNNTTTYTYDALDRKASVKDKNGNVTVYTYDAAGNVTEATDALLNKVIFTYDANGNKLTGTDPPGNTTTYTYDALNRVVGVTGPLGSTSTNTYDKPGRVISTTNAARKVTGFTYDAMGRLIKVTDSNGGIVKFTYDSNGNRLTMTEPKGNTTTYIYDALNRLTSKTEPLGGQYQYTYDAVGNVVSLNDPNGNTITYNYDALNRITATAYPDSSTVVLAYDANGNRISMVDSVGTSIYQYDVLNRLTRYTDPFGQTVDYGYDANGNGASLTYPDGKVVAYTYDVLNRLISVEDWSDRTTAYSYDSAGRVTGAVNPNTTTSAYIYDTAGRLTGLTNSKSDASIISNYSYTLDAIGNHTQAVQDEPMNSYIPGANIVYSYDNENRLNDVSGMGNTFDANGNMTAKGSNTFNYDFNDRLIESNVTGVITQYHYDGAGNRLERVQNGVTTRYVLDVNGSLANVLAETDGGGSITAYYVYGLGLISKVLPNGTAFYYHYNSLGSTVALTDASQNITDSYAYDPFGRLANVSGSNANPFRYVGRYGLMDEGNGTLYVRARYYMPELGRFMTKDPLAGEDGDSQSLNRYVYAVNNPVRMVDVSGYSASEGSGYFKLSFGSSDPILLHNVLISSSNINNYNSTPVLVEGSDINNSSQILKGGLTVTEGVVNVAGGLYIALPGLIIAQTGVLALPACVTVVGCIPSFSAMGYGIALATPGLVEMGKGGLAIIEGTGDIFGGMYGTNNPFKDTVVEKWDNYLKWGTLGL